LCPLCRADRTLAELDSSVAEETSGIRSPRFSLHSALPAAIFIV
jgi:hypothetical protein